MPHSAVEVRQQTFMRALSMAGVVSRAAAASHLLGGLAGGPGRVGRAFSAAPAAAYRPTDRRRGPPGRACRRRQRSAGDAHVELRANCGGVVVQRPSRAASARTTVSVLMAVPVAHPRARSAVGRARPRSDDRLRRGGQRRRRGRRPAGRHLGQRPRLSSVRTVSPASAAHRAAGGAFGGQPGERRGVKAHASPLHAARS